MMLKWLQVLKKGIQWLRSSLDKSSLTYWLKMSGRFWIFCEIIFYFHYRHQRNQMPNGKLTLIEYTKPSTEAEHYP